MTALQTCDIDNNAGAFEIIEKVVISGDLSKLNSEQRVHYYNKVCESLGLNPYTRPFDYITLNGKLTLYAKKDATEQLRKINGISITGLDGKMIDDLYIVTATAKTRDGRIDQATGAVNLGTLKGEMKANAIMKAETKAKRRVTLSIAGLGWADESEIDAIPDAKPANVNMTTGEIEAKTCAIQVQSITEIDAIPDAKPANVNMTTGEIEAKTGAIQVQLITKEQANELADLHNKCQPEYKVSVVNMMKSKAIAGWNKLPFSMYESVKQAALEHLEYKDMTIESEMANVEAVI